VRVVFVFAVVVTGGAALLAYLAMWIIMPEETAPAPTSTGSPPAPPATPGPEPGTRPPAG
jgi:threonine/homoserine/homoserine lactone efflux protein